MCIRPKFAHSPAKKVTHTWLPSHVAKLKRCASRSRVVMTSPFPSSNTPNGDRTTAASSVTRKATMVAFCVKGRSNTAAMIAAPLLNRDRLRSEVVDLYRGFPSWNGCGHCQVLAGRMKLLDVLNTVSSMVKYEHQFLCPQEFLCVFSQLPSTASAGNIDGDPAIKILS